MSLINCEINLFLTSSKMCVIIYNDVENQRAMTNTTIYVPVVTLSTEDNAKLLQQLKSGFKITVNWNKHLPIPELLAKKPKFKSFSCTKLSRNKYTFCFSIRE